MTQVKPAGPDYFTWEPSHSVGSVVVPLFPGVVTDPASSTPSSSAPQKKQGKAKQHKRTDVMPVWSASPSGG